MRRGTIPVVLRLVPAALTEGRLAGEVELAETGQRAVVADAAELVAFLRSQQPEAPIGAGRPPEP